MGFADSPAHHHEEIAPVLGERQVQIGLLKQHALQCMAQLHGWCAPEKASLLIDLIARTRPKVVVEIGVWGGKSLIPMAMALKENHQGVIYGIDPWMNFESTQWVVEEVNRDFWDRANHEWVYQDLLAKIGLFELQSQVQIVRATSEAAEPIPEIDLLHIDGNHSEHASFFDVTKWVPLVRSGGWIILDDMKWFEKGVFTTAKAGEWLNTHCHKLGEFNDVCTWGVWVKP
jgi:predicted O-methyltransferase YrrM